MIKVVFGLGAILGPKIERNMKKHSPKNHKKITVEKATLLAQFGVFGGTIIEILHILGSFWVPASISFLCFSGLRFWLDFLAFVMKGVKNAKNEKVSFVS